MKLGISDRHWSCTCTDILILATLSFVLSSLAYHPFYFGDELTTFFARMKSGTFGSIYYELNQYKPRLLFDLLWAGYGYLDVPRYVPMLVNAASLSGVAASLYLISVRYLDANRVEAIAIGAVAITSRFGIMLYYDYLSGNIETISFWICLAALMQMLRMLTGRSFNTRGLFWLLALSCGMVLVHERYIVISLVFAAFILIQAWRDRGCWKGFVFWAMLVGLLPLFTFFMAGKLFQSVPLSTGTAGRPIQLGFETLHVLVSYVSNLVFATNFGLPWFVGTLNLSTDPGRFVIPLLAITLGAVWVIGLSRVRWSGIRWDTLLLVLFALCALIVVASLPGATKQESRWMFPCAGLLGLVALSLFRKTVRWLVLAMLLIVNAVYFFTGSYKSIFNVESSVAADRFGSFYSTMPSGQGSRGVIIHAPEPQTSWWLAGDTILGNDGLSGEAFCRINFHVDYACMSPPVAIQKKGSGGFDYGLQYIPKSGAYPPYTVLSKAALDAQAVDDSLSPVDFSDQASTLVLTPSVIDLCKNLEGTANVSVSWRVTSKTVPIVEIWLKPPNSFRRIFSESPSTGSAETGPWVTPGVAFMLIDPKTKKTMAVATVRGKPCTH